VPLESIVRRRDGVDVALFRVPADAVGDVPVLPLHEGPLDSLPDQRAIVVGYPTGLEALMAKADNQIVAELQALAADRTTIIARLAAAHCIAPVITQGIIGNVRETMIEYDAPTTHGGSGGPVFGADGTVVAVNFAIMREFAGLNFGVPIRFGRELLGP
jgi:S1-C subfamily serine protease